MAEKRIIMKQEWHNLLFLHWPVPISLICNQIPKQLELDTYNNKAWIGIIPFQMKKLRPSYAFPIPKISNFTEINLRTYVKDKYNRKGVWFFSLDTQNSFGNWIAKTFFHLNYRYAKTSFLSDTEERNTCKFKLPNTKHPTQIFSWQHTQDSLIPSKKPESLDFFLTERYRLYSFNKEKNTLLTGTLNHEPYKLNRPKLINYSTDLFSSNAINHTNNYPESVLACRSVKVSIFPIERVN